MPSLLALVLFLMGTPLSVHYQRLPAYAQTAYKTNDDFFRFVELWRLDAEVKAFAEANRKFDANRADFKRRQAAFDLEQAELRRKREAAERDKQNPGG